MGQNIHFPMSFQLNESWQSIKLSGGFSIAIENKTMTTGGKKRIFNFAYLMWTYHWCVSFVHTIRPDVIQRDYTIFRAVKIPVLSGSPFFFFCMFNIEFPSICSSCVSTRFDSKQCQLLQFSFIFSVLFTLF